MAKRLSGYDYRQQGFYFVTICTLQHRLVFGTVEDGQVLLRRPGQIAESVWVTLPRRFANVKLDEYIFMPNHMHTIVELTDHNATDTKPRVPLWEVVRTFKAATAYQIRREEDNRWFAWEDNYQDSVIRTEASLERIRHYIRENPARWTEDEHYKRY